MFVLVLAVIAIIITFYSYKLSRIYKYWEEREVTFDKPTFLLGTFAENIFRIKNIQEIVLNIFRKFSKHRYVGVFQFMRPVLLILDSELVKQITVKDFDSFSDHMVFAPIDIDPLWGKNLFQMSSKDGWHTMRSTLSPSFTGSKLKTMFALMQTCSNQVIEYFKNQNKIVSVNVKDAFTRFANDIIGTTAFGIECNSLKNSDNEFYLMGKSTVDFSGFRLFKFFVCFAIPSLMKLFRITIYDNRVSSFFRRIIKETMDYRRINKIIRPDMIHLMLEAQKSQNNQNNNNHHKQLTEFSDESMTAQALIFFTAGFETVSSAMSFVAYELAANPDAQQKLYDEIKETLVDGQSLTYDLLCAMNYLDCVVSETLRLHTPSPLLDRRCVKPYTIEPVLPWEKPVHIEKGTVIFIPAVAFHNDEKYFPNPTKFDPERFNSANKSMIPSLSYIPFGIGPRNCIGSRFALIEIKLMTVDLVRNFEILPNERTSIPLKLSKGNWNTIPSKGFWLSLKPRVSN